MTPHHCRIEEKPLAFYEQFHILVLGLDSLEARRFMNQVACSFLGAAPARLVADRPCACFPACTPWTKTLPLNFVHEKILAALPTKAVFCHAWTPLQLWSTSQHVMCHYMMIACMRSGA